MKLVKMTQKQVLYELNAGGKMVFCPLEMICGAHKIDHLEMILTGESFILDYSVFLLGSQYI